MNSTTDDYRSKPLEAFSEWYSLLHGYISISICTIGIPLNIINIIVLTRKNMLSPINFILTWLAVFDSATMISYIPFAYHFYCRFPSYSMSPEKNSFVWMNFLLVYLNFSSTTHTIAIWLAKGSLTRMRRLIRARIAICIIVLMSLLLMVPNYLSHKLQKFNLHGNRSVYVFEDWHLGTAEVKPIKLTALILYGIVAKLLPCVMIIIFGGLLLRTLNKSLQAKRRLYEGGVCFGIRRSNKPSRTTTMLLVVIVLFVVTELPQGILIVCSIFLPNFFDNVYVPLGDVMDLLALLNNAINFVLYCSMSHEFRLTFNKLFCSFTTRGNGSYINQTTSTQHKSSLNYTEMSVV
jgi:hypothetical protein